MTEAKQKLRIGEPTPDGTVYAGISPYTGNAMYTTPRDAPGTYTFNEAAQYAKNLSAHDHHDFRVPTTGELNVLFENRNKGKLRGTFNETASYPVGWYWSSTPSLSYLASPHRLSDGGQYDLSRDGGSSLRLVR
jgi:hypothetical protein